MVSNSSHNVTYTMVLLPMCAQTVACVTVGCLSLLFFDVESFRGFQPFESLPCVQCFHVFKILLVLPVSWIPVSKVSLCFRFVAVTNVLTNAKVGPQLNLVLKKATGSTGDIPLHSSTTPTWKIRRHEKTSKPNNKRHLENHAAKPSVLLWPSLV